MRSLILRATLDAEKKQTEKIKSKKYFILKAHISNFNTK